MMKMPDVNTDFIKEWETKYYKCKKDYKDEHDYRKLIRATQGDIAKGDTISESTLKNILKWKDKRERVQAKVNWGKYDTIYAPRFQLIISGSVSDHNKLMILLWDAGKLKGKLPVDPSLLARIQGKADGFGIPVASTVLHYIFPDKFPIFDIRTAEALYLNCKIKSPDRSDYREYGQFRSAMLHIAGTTSLSLHAIDRALFAYHRDRIQPGMNRIFKRWISASKLGSALNLTLEAPPELRRLLLDQMKRDP